jgi:hypothetical protein
MILIVLMKKKYMNMICVLDILPNGNGLDLIKLLKIAGQQELYYYLKNGY